MSDILLDLDLEKPRSHVVNFDPVLFTFLMRAFHALNKRKYINN